MMHEQEIFAAKWDGAAGQFDSVNVVGSHLLYHLSELLPAVALTQFA